MTSSGAVLYFLSQLGTHRMVCPIAKMHFKNVGYIITTLEFTEVDCNSFKIKFGKQHSYRYYSYVNSIQNGR